MIPRDIKRATPIYQVLVYDIIIWKVSKILIFVLCTRVGLISKPSKPSKPHGPT